MLGADKKIMIQIWIKRIGTLPVEKVAILGGSLFIAQKSIMVKRKNIDVKNNQN